jgi:transcriptional regulator with XRE-family HTH domain
VPKPKFTQAESLFRKLLKELRLDKKLTQAQLAERLGRPQSYVSKYEAGERRLDFVETFFLCNALEITIEAFAKAFKDEVGNTEKRKRG